MKSAMDPGSAQSDRIRALEPINRLEPVDQDALIAEARLLIFATDETIFHEGGDDGLANYLLQGSVEFLWNNRPVKLIDARDKAATQALDLSGKKRFTARARSESTILQIQRSQLEQKLHRVEVASKLSSLNVSEPPDGKWAAWKVRLLRSKIFKTLPMSHIQEIVHCLERISVSTDEIIIKQGEPGDYYYIIDEGECTVVREPPGGLTDIHVADLTPGEGFGEESLMTGAARNATVRMKSDGHLLRMTRDDFHTWIEQPMVNEVSLDEALACVKRGGAWIDVRPPDQYLAGAFETALNIPLTLLRLECRKLSGKRRYIVCGGNNGRAAVGSLLLVQRGLHADCLNQSVVEALDHREDPSLPPPDPSPEPTDTIVPFPVASNEPAAKIETVMNDRDQPPEDRAGHTARPTPDVESAEPIPRDLYDDTYVGKSLADLIDQMQTRHQELLEETTAPAQTEEDGVSVIDLESFENEVEQTLPQPGAESPVLTLADDAGEPSPAASSAPPPIAQSPVEAAADDELGQLMKDFEHRLRDYVRHASQGQRQRLQSQLADRITKVKQAAVQEVKRQAKAYRDKYRSDHAEREQSMKAQYDKLMALAHRISRQKAELQRARRELEGKLQATVRLQKEIGGLRDALTLSIGNFDDLEEEDSDVLAPIDLPASGDQSS